MNNALRMLAHALVKYYPNAENTEKIIIQCATAAAVADVLPSAIPGLAVPATIVACFGAVWVMYGRLCSELGITLQKKILKLLARAALANIAANLGGAIAALIAGMFVPGGSIVASAITAFATIYLAGIIFLKLILNMAETSSDIHSFSDIDTNEMKKKVNQTTVSKKDLDAAINEYKNNQSRK